MLSRFGFTPPGRRFHETAVTLLTAIALLSAAGCAKIAEPQPPEIRIPKPAADLTARQISDYIVITVSMPDQNTDGSPATTLRNLEIFRIAEDRTGNSQPLPEEQFFERAARVQQIPASSFSSYLQGKRLVLQDRPQPPAGSTLYMHAFRYAVLFTNKKNQDAGLSNQVRIAPIPIPEPPREISAEVFEDSIRLKWIAPEKNADGSMPPRIAGFSIYKSEESERFPSAPINDTPIPRPEYVDRNFQFDKKYYYAISTIGSLQNPYAESLPSKPYVVAARDVFPPAPARDLNVILESGYVTLLWFPSSSPDVAGYRIYRQEKGTASRVLLQSELIATPSFRDTKVEPGKNYQYSIQAVDTHGNESAEVQAEVEIR